MNVSRLLGTAALGAAIGVAAPLHGWNHGGFAPVRADEQGGGLRPAVGLPLSKAKSLLAAHSYAAASAQVNIADRQKGKTSNESFVIEQMRGAIAQASGDTATASRVFGQLIDSGRLGGAQLTQMLLAQTSLAYQTKDYKGVIGWAQRYTKSGGHDPAVRTLVIQAYYLQGDYADAAQAQKAQIDETLRARKVPPEDQLQLLAACQKQTSDHAGLHATMLQLVTYYPKQSYWADMIYSVQTAPAFSDRLELDLDRFKLRVGTLTSQNDFMQMAQLALGEDDAGHATAIIAAANAQHAFGTPAQAAREQRLTALVQKTAADTHAKLDQTLRDIRSARASTSQQLLEAGQNYAGFKQYDVGIPLMQEAVAKGDLRRPEVAQLRIGEALVDAGNKAAAMAAFAKVPKTTDGASDLAALWLLWLRSQPALTPV